MKGIGVIERITHNRVVSFFKNSLEYQYLGNWTDRENNSNVEAEYLYPFLTKIMGYETDLAKRAIDILVKVAGDTSRSLYEVNKDVYSLIRYGVPVKMEAGSPTQTVFLFDFKNSLNNHFAVAEEVTVKQEVIVNDETPRYEEEEKTGFGLFDKLLKKGKEFIKDDIKDEDYL